MTALAPPTAPTALTARTSKLALYGRPSAGKTSILAALSLPRIAHPDGLTCQWIQSPKDYPRPAGDPSTWDPETDPAAAFHLGRDWLEKAIASLRAGEVPDANPVRVPYRFLFRFNTPEQNYLVELIDYSGELIQPSIDDNRLATLLLEHMQQVDGLLILAEAPGEDEASLGDQLHRLSEAFGLLATRRAGADKMRCPVALVVNKWDRRGPEGGKDATTRATALQHFLDDDPNLPHHALRNNIRNSVSADCFAAFAVSAFGPSQLVTIESRRPIERPRQLRPLQSFGLEDPFLWVARTRENLERQDHQASVKRYESDLQGYQTWAKRRRSLVVALIVLVPLFLYAFLVSLWWRFDSDGERSVAAILGHPNATLEEMQHAENWLTPYAEGGGWVLCLHRWHYSEEQAQVDLQELRGRREVEQARRREASSRLDELLRARDIVDAAGLILRQPQHALWTQELTKRFQKVAVDWLQEDKNLNVANRNFASGRQKLQAVYKSGDVAKLLTREQMEKVEGMHLELQIAWDRHLYESVREAPSLESCKRYLNEAPLQYMSKEVKQMRDFLEFAEGVSPVPKLTVQVYRVDWHPNSRAHPRNILTLTHKGKDVVQMEVASFPGQHSILAHFPQARGGLPDLKLTDKLTLEVTLFRPTGFIWPFGANETSKKSWTGLPKNLDGHKLVLGGSHEHCVTIQLPNLPRRPDLPAWRKP